MTCAEIRAYFHGFRISSKTHEDFDMAETVESLIHAMIDSWTDTEVLEKWDEFERQVFFGIVSDDHYDY